MKELEQRSYSFEVRAEDEETGAIITGRPIIYGQPTEMSDFTEVIERGALDKADLRDVRFLVNHDTSRIPLARSRNNNGNSTMQLTVDDMGMSIRVSLDVENNAEARSLYSAVKRGDISGMSFMFSLDGFRWDNLESERPTRAITEIGKVVEVSACTFPAYDTTTIQARAKKDLEDARAELEAARANEKRLALERLSLEKEKVKAFLKI